METVSAIANAVVEVESINLPTEFDKVQGFNQTIIINNVTNTVEASVHAVSNMEFLMETFS